MTPLPMHTTPASVDSASVLPLDHNSVFAFASPTRTIVTSGPVAVLGEQSDETLSHLLRQLRDAGLVDACIVGCHPFCAGGEADEKPRLLLAPRPLIGQSLADVQRKNVPPHVREDSQPLSSVSTALPRWVLDEARATTSERRFVAAIQEALSKLENSALRKVVLARALDLSVSDEGECSSQRVPALIRHVLLQQPARYRFAVRLPAGTTTNATSRWLFGLSPELLLRKVGASVESFPLAGSAPRSHDPRLDSERATALLRSEKDSREHRFVVDAIAEQLAPHCSKLEVPNEPQLVSTPTLWHLGTRIHGTLRDQETSSHTLAKLLHPTPAVCGYPREFALEAIRQLECVQRGYFAGMVGWCDASGDGEWAVSIRCGEFDGRRLRLYAGAGIVEGSDPELEVAETEAKLRTLLSALGIDSRAGG